MWVCEFGGGGKRDFEKKAHSEQDFAISNQYLVCKFAEMGQDMFLRKNKPREIIVLCRIIGGATNSIKIRLRVMLVCYIVLRTSRNVHVFGCLIMIVYQDFFKVHFFYDNLNHFIVRAPSTSHNQMHH